ncbi:MAG TPA: diadenylate cyclase [Deltaproteobacteria bacterium]|nr:diadenylate cyclase [Deltaproteobacteria bacterium]
MRPQAWGHPFMEKKTIRNFQDLGLSGRGVNVRVLNEVISLAVEIAREGREGRRIGTMFVVSDSENTLKRSATMILDPLACQPERLRHIEDPNLRETVKELAQLDGAFIVSDSGIVLSACRYIDASSRGVRLTMGLGSRHVAAASITKHTNAVAVVVSESAIVRIFDNGELIGEIIPEEWTLHPPEIHTGIELPAKRDDHGTFKGKRV